jgi:hypothetical protein
LVGHHACLWQRHPRISQVLECGGVVLRRVFRLDRAPLQRFDGGGHVLEVASLDEAFCFRCEQFDGRSVCAVVRANLCIGDPATNAQVRVLVLELLLANVARRGRYQLVELTWLPLYIGFADNVRGRALAELFDQRMALLVKAGTLRPILARWQQPYPFD